MPDALNSINVQQKERKRVQTRRRLFRLSHVQDPNSHANLQPESRYPELRFPLLDTGDATASLRSRLDLKMSGNGFPVNEAPVYQWSWLRNSRKPGWKRSLVGLPPITVTTCKNEPVNTRCCSPLFENNDSDSMSNRPQTPAIISPDAEDTKVDVTPNDSSNNVEGLDIKKTEAGSDISEIKRRQLVVVVPYSQYDSDFNESDEDVEVDKVSLNKNNMSRHEKQALKHESHRKDNTDKKAAQKRKKLQTVYNKQIEKSRSPLKSVADNEIRKSALRMRVLIRKTIASTEARIKECRSRNEQCSPEDENTNKNSIVDFSDKVRVQWQRELREILNTSPSYERIRDSTGVKNKTNSGSQKIATILPPSTSNDNLFPFQDKCEKTNDGFNKLSKQTELYPKRSEIDSNSALTPPVAVGQETDTFARRKSNPAGTLDFCRTRRTRKQRDVCGRRENSPSDSFDCNFFWNLLEASKGETAIGVKHVPKDSIKSSECWTIHSPMYKNTFLYKKKLT